MSEIIGTPGNDVLVGTPDNDVITGDFGDDVIDGGAGDDFIDGGPGSDTLNGGAGNDEIIGAGKGDTLNGTDSAAAGAGEVDTLTGGSGVDKFVVGDDAQAYYAAAGDADYVLIKDFKSFQDTIQLNGLPSDYSLSQVDADTHLLRGGELVAVLEKTTAADLDLNANYFSYVGSGVNLVGTDADDVLNGADGFDAIAGGGGNDVITGGAGVDSLLGEDGDDSINGGADNDIINGGNGNDSLEGGDGDDFIDGGGGSDTIIGGAGNDEILGAGAGDFLNGTDGVAAGADEIDTLKGSSGADRFIVGDDAQAYYVATGDADYAVINDFKSFQDTIQLNGLPSDYSLSQVDADTHLLRGGELVAVLEKTTAADLDLNANYFSYVGSGVNLVGTDADDVLNGADGFDAIAGGGGNDVITGGAGVDSLLGEDGDDSINGGADNDIINGGNGNDSLEGGDGDDFIDGGGGSDTITGGAGNDEILGAGSGDILNGTDSLAAGSGEVDTLKGSSGVDQFIVGDDAQAYYVAQGDADYVLLEDFKSFQDIIQLQGSPSDYSLSQVDANTHLLRDGELVAILANTAAANLDLNAAYFQYVGEVVNTPPTAVNDMAATDEDTAVTISAADLLSNDMDSDGLDTLQIVEVSNASNGTVVLDDGNVIFTPDPDFNGEASFDYVVSDGGDTSTATVSVLVNAVNDGPTTTGIAGFVVTDNAPNTEIDLFEAFSDVEDADADLTFEVVDNTNSSLFQNFEIDGDTGTLTLDYASGASGITALTIRATDTNGASVQTTFNVQVQNATFFGDRFYGGEGNDYLNGGFGRDRLFGLEGNDTLRGGVSSDYLDGGAGDDLLDGAGFTSGLLERDILIGGTGSDTFALGNAHQAYYTGFYSWDYAVIKDFNSQEDKLQLHGSIDDYRTVSSQGNTYLYNTTAHYWCPANDLVAVFKDNASVVLNTDSVEFVG